MYGAINDGFYHGKKPAPAATNNDYDGEACLSFRIYNAACNIDFFSVPPRCAAAAHGFSKIMDYSMARKLCY